jgi:hypothetical protein
MKKLPTLFPKDPTDLGRVIDGELLYPLEELVAYLKLDGTACAVINNLPYFRYDARLKSKGKDVPLQVVLNNLPKGAIACQEVDPLSGHWPHWIPPQPKNRLHTELVKVWSPELEDGTYEGIGPIIGANPHNEVRHIWVKHNDPRLLYSLEKALITIEKVGAYQYFKSFFFDFQWEGLVFYREEEPVAKLRRSDFGYGRYLSVSEYLCVV